MGRTSVLRFYSKDLDPLVENQGQLESYIMANANRLLSVTNGEYLKGGKDANVCLVSLRCLSLIYHSFFLNRGEQTILRILVYALYALSSSILGTIVWLTISLIISRIAFQNSVWCLS